MPRPWPLVVVFLSACATLNTESAATRSANEFAKAIARIESSDPNSPAELSVRLSYAEFLLSTDEGPCQQRIDNAQKELDRVEANPQAGVMFPDGWSRTAAMEYSLHLARADCAGDSGGPTELRAAVTAARRAVQLYTDTFDYPTAATMQFNVAVLLNRLGDSSAAITALESTLAMDREFGFQDDARDNYRQLLTWQDKPADEAQVAQLLQGFPKRQVNLKFAWHPEQAHLSLEDSRDCLWDGAITHSNAAAAYERQIAGDTKGGWTVSYVQDAASFQPGVWPTPEGSQVAKMVFAPAAIARPNFKVNATGQFVATINSEGLAAQLLNQTDGLIRVEAPAGGAPELMKVALDTAAIVLSSGLLTAGAAENFQVETSMWAGATLDQGVWYQISAPLSLPGLSRVVVQQRLEFAFTRMVPCTASASESTCVEVVVRTTPDQKVVDRLMDSYVASSATRLIMDPATLQSYSREDRLYWYASIGPQSKEATLESEHFTSTVTPEPPP